MERFSLEERIFVVQAYYASNNSVKSTIRKFAEKFGEANKPHRKTVSRIVSKFEETGSVKDRPADIHARSVRNQESVQRVREDVSDHPETSIRRRSRQLGIPSTSLHRILHEDLHNRAYKVQLVQELKPTDHQARRDFADRMLEVSAENPEFFDKILFSDEAHFQLNGYVNSQNCRIWGSENPHAIVQRSLKPPRVTVWCGFSAKGVIGPYFFEDEEGKTVTVTGLRYREMLETFLWPELDSQQLGNEIWFQQDGATSHTASATMAILKEKFPRRLLSLGGDISWPPRSCDLTPLDFFLWGYLKDRVYQNKPVTLDDLKENIRQVIGGISQEICQNVVQNYGVRIVSCKKALGGYFKDVLFHV